jgi:hypothetical protein
LAAVLTHCEKGFKRVKGYAVIEAVIATIVVSHTEEACKAA